MHFPGDVAQPRHDDGGTQHPSQSCFYWMRPDLMGWGCEINHYVPTSILTDVHNALLKFGGEDSLQKFVDGPFGKLLELKRKSTPNNAIHELLAREVTHPTISEYEKWFHIGGVNVRFGAPEYALVTGLMFGESDFNPNSKHEVPDTSLLWRHYNGKRIRVSTLCQDFINGNLGTAEDYIKAANLLVYYLMLLCRDNPWIDNWAWVLVEDGYGWSRFPWGAYSFQVLCHQISVLPKEPADIKNVRGSYSFFGPVWAFNIWAYEVISELRYICGARTSYTLKPRFRRWMCLRSFFDYGDFFEEFQLKCEVTLTPDTEEMSQPYFLTSISSTSLSVPFIPSKRHSFKKIPPMYREPKVKNDTTHPERKIQPSTKAASTSTSVLKRHKGQANHGDNVGQRACVHGDECLICNVGESWTQRFVELVCLNMEGDTGGRDLLTVLAKKVAEGVSALLNSRSELPSAHH